MALGLAYWQYRPMVPYVQVIWGDLGSAARPVALIYLFTTFYMFARVLLSLYTPRRMRPPDRRWLAGLIGAVEAGTIAALSIIILPRL